jgi:hypothetical protein
VDREALMLLSETTNAAGVRDHVRRHGRPGRTAGRVLNVDFDPRSGTIRAIVTTGGRIDGDRLLACGSYAVVVRTGNSHTTDDVHRGPELVDGVPR